MVAIMKAECTRFRHHVVRLPVEDVICVLTRKQYNQLESHAVCLLAFIVTDLI